MNPTTNLKITYSSGSVKELRLEPYLQGLNQNIDFNLIGNSVFLLEQQLMDNYKIKKIEIPTVGDYTNEVCFLIEKLILETTKKPIKVALYKNQTIFPRKTEQKTTCLFSGGIDSLSGLLNAIKKFKKITACTTIHNDQHTIRKIITNQTKIIPKEKITYSEFKAADHKSIVRNTRGALYTLNGLSLGNNEIIISECGTTMFQPKFAPFDTITKTTNPAILKITKEIAEKIANKKIRLIEPNSDLTKSEIIANCPNKKAIKLTNSCFTWRWASAQKTHEGNCYGCITRKIGEVVAGVNDDCYRRNILEEQKNTNYQASEILQLISFSCEFLSNYEDLPNYTVSEIIKHKKIDLFKRTATDTIATLYLLRKKRRLRNPLFNKLLDRGLKIVNKDVLQNRIAEVREQKNKPNFEIELN